MEIFKTIFPNGMIYVGQSTKNNPNYFGSGVIVTNYIKKYGKKELKKEILYICEDQIQLDYYEEMFIERLDSTNKLIGYNILKGSSNKFGEGSPMLIKEVRDKVSKTKKDNYKLFGSKLKGVPKSEEAKANMSKAGKGRISPRKGVKVKQSSIDKRKATIEANGGYYHPTPETISKMLATKEKNGGYSHSEASKKKISQSNKGRIISETSRKSSSEKLKGHSNTPTKAVIQYDIKNNFIAEYYSVTEAAKIIGIPQCYISTVCTGRQKTTKGFIFKFKNK